MAWLSLKTLFQLLLEFFTFFNKNKLIIAEQIKSSNKWSYLTIDVLLVKLFKLELPLGLLHHETHYF